MLPGKYPREPTRDGVSTVSRSLQYSIGGDSLVDPEATRKADETCYTICNTLTGCKQLRIVCRGECAKNRRE
eukprot:693571-Prymnesium_polylepis.2